MAKSRLPVLSKDVEGEWLAPAPGFPPVPSYRENMKLLEMEEKAQAAERLLGSVVPLVTLGRQGVAETGGEHILYFYGSIDQIVMEQRTQVFKILRERIVIDLST